MQPKLHKLDYFGQNLKYVFNPNSSSFFLLRLKKYLKRPYDFYRLTYPMVRIENLN